MKLFSPKKEWYVLKDAIQNYRENRYKPLDYYIWKNQYAERLKRFKDIHKGEDCFIIGNGPSLNKIDIETLNDFYTFGLNKIYLINKKKSLHIDYLVSINPYVIEQGIEKFKQMDATIFLSFLSVLKKNLEFTKSINYVYVKPGNIQFSRNIKDYIGPGYTVTFTAMQLAYYMGFSRVFLVGVDHNFFQSGKPNEKQVLSGDDPNHFDPNYFKGQEWQLADLDGSEAGYMLAKYYFNQDQKQIIDATHEGKLTIFPKITFSEALRIAKKK
ncbi:6-hydroxymethylpterin diphosphokinase MptE-like protein [Catalinimonas sp. 4WD22]|uniref:6-hydroxymethylpterin diphosphokinase MptE-like protein n=1 Tax=Catalinimonas locisalis TaxID=3133978 RepID=UPI003100E15D